MKYPKPVFSQDGAVYRIKFTNFMQYSDTEFILGPNLNVIIGPNGAGKSTIVNGICVGLAGKLSVLGRATSLADYVLVGQEEAIIEIELHKNNGPNLVVRRKWNLTGKSTWQMSGKKCSEKEVKECISKLRIQVDNLCQFLPQDKVHDFSRLNNKGLLDSTIDAVGNTDLKEKHQELKTLQSALDSGDDIHERKINLLDEKKNQCAQMQDDVKAYEEKKRLLEKFDMLAKKRIWVEFDLTRTDTFNAKKNFSEAKKKLEDSESKLEPLKTKIVAWKKMVQQAETSAEAENEVIKELVSKGAFQSKVMEEKEKELLDLDDQAISIQRRVKEKATTIDNYRSKIKDLERDIAENGGDDQTIRPKLEQAKQDTQQALRNLENEKQEHQTKVFELKNLVNEEKRIEGEIRLLKSVDARKLSTLKAKCSQAYEALQWLRNNMNQFQGEVYEPFIVSGNVTDEQFSIFLENSINGRDLSTFFFEDSEDMNKFLNITRNQMKLERVGAAQVPATGIDSYQPRVPVEELQPLGLVSYLKDVVQAPAPTLAYMCQTYNLHNTAVFDPAAEKYNDRIAGEYHLSKYYFGTKCQTVSRSKYSGKVLTRTQEIRSNNMLGVGIDQEAMDRLSSDMQKLKQRRSRLEDNATSIKHNCEQLSVELEAKRKAQRELEQTKNLVAKNMSVIATLQKRLRAAMSNEEEDRELTGVKASKRKAMDDMLKTGRILVKTLQSSGEARIRKDLKTIQISPLKMWISNTDKEMQSIREETQEIRTEYEEADRQVKKAQEVMMEHMKIVKKATGVNKANKKPEPPKEYLDFWAKEEFPARLVDIDALSAELEARADCTDTVDQGVLERYRLLSDQIVELEDDVRRMGKDKARQERQITEVKNSWLEGLNTLVDSINTRFSDFFDKMGFVGEVKLHTGAHENDFDNYGIKIFVKFRNSQPLQELTAHHQSGGERSVSTAIFMLALQALTTVPFRCVDEINQGMDARNERLVFDLLVKTSCEESNAQYFLLTPKLLPGLEYNPKMSVLIVHNGKEMCHHEQWSIDSFVTKALNNRSS